MPRTRLQVYIPLLMVLFISLACRQPVKPLSIPTIIYNPPSSSSAQAPVINLPTAVPTLVARSMGDTSIASPTPDVQKDLPAIRTQEEQYTVRSGDSLGGIAAQFEITVKMLIEANKIDNPNLLAVGQELTVPAPVPGEQGTAFKIVPDSELVYGPHAQEFDVEQFVAKYDSYLGRYSEDVEGETLSGPQIVRHVAQDYSVNPRLLLAVLEYQSGWVTQANPAEETRAYPIGMKDGWRNGLYRQLCWAADMLNKGYYFWKVNAIGGWLLPDGMIIPVDPTINAGTAAVQQLFAYLYTRDGWDKAVSADGLYHTFSGFFGHPFDYAIEPLIPQDLEQPALQLPFEEGVDWAFTGGPHGGWGEGSAWAALDFAPGAQGLGCGQSDLWVVAAADGVIVRADHGRVIQDLDGDGNEGTGWVILYMHIENRDRVQAGDYVKVGERIGHPSCEGGYSTGTHVHLARRYNGEWIPADQANQEHAVPFNLDGWISGGDGIEYNGYLQRDGDTIQAWEGFYPGNTIHK